MSHILAVNWRDKAELCAYLLAARWRDVLSRLSTNPPTDNLKDTDWTGVALFRGAQLLLHPGCCVLLNPQKTISVGLATPGGSDVRPVMFQVFSPLSKCFLWAHFWMVGEIKPEDLGNVHFRVPALQNHFKT